MRLGHHMAMAGGALALALLAAPAQTNPVTSSSVRSGSVLSPDRPTAVDANVSDSSSVRPSRPERPTLEPEVRDRLERFKLEARAYLAQQEALKKKMYGANEQERAALRQQLRVLREAWLERAREMRQEYRDEKQRLERRLPGHRELFDDLRNDANDQLKSETRSRRGID